MVVIKWSCFTKTQAFGDVADEDDVTYPEGWRQVIEYSGDVSDRWTYRVIASLTMTLRLHQ